jgi:hypothetical protein
MPISKAFCRQGTALLLGTFFILTTTPGWANMSALLEMADKLDQLDKLDLDQLLENAASCTRARDFPCAETQLQKAVPLANATRGQAALHSARQALDREIERVAQERRELARRVREIELAEARLNEQEEEAEREADRARYDTRQADSGMSTAQGIALFGSLLGQSLAQQRAFQAAQAVQSQRIQRDLYATVPDVARKQQRFAQERQQLQAQMAELRSRPQTSAPAVRVTQAVPAVAQQQIQPRPSTTSPGESNAASNVSQQALPNQPQTLAEVQARIRQLQADASRPSQPASPQTSYQSQPSSSGAGRDSGISANNGSPTSVAPKNPVATAVTADYCMSFGTPIPIGRSVCFQSTNLQYFCRLDRGVPLFQYIQKLSMKIDPKDTSACYHVDRNNERPTVEMRDR